MDFSHQLGLEGGNRAGSEAAIVYRADLVDEKIGILCEPFPCLDPDTERRRIVDEICRERDDDRGWMPCIEKSLVLKDEDGPGLSGFRPLLRV